MTRRQLCGKLYGGLSHLLFTGPACHRSIASYIADNGLSHLHSIPPLVPAFDAPVKWVPVGILFGMEQEVKVI